MRKHRAWPLLTWFGAAAALASLPASAYPHRYPRFPNFPDSRDDHRRDREDGDGNTVTVLPSLAGIWVADGNEPMPLAAGCTLMFRVSTQPASLLRAVICANGNIQADRAKITGITVEPSRFPAAFQLRTRLGEVRSSCGDASSSFGPATSLAFDLKTAAGGEAATFAYTQVNDREIAVHSGGAIDTFDRNRDCDTIVKVAGGLADSDENRLVKLAAKVCQLGDSQAGCFTDGGFSSEDSDR